MNAHIVESPLDPASAVIDYVHPPGEPWMKEIKAGQIFRIVDLEGNQAVDTIFYNAQNPEERYSLIHTILAQGNIYLTVGTQIMSSEGRPMLTIVADTCGRHDTVGGGACSSESNTVRYAIEKRCMHSCRDNFLLAIAHDDHGLIKRDIVSNINFFMNVPVEADGTLGIVDGLSAPGKSLTLRAERDTLVLVSNCPQINNPCNGFDPTPVRMVISA
jgi:uncharacterized protein